MLRYFYFGQLFGPVVLFAVVVVVVVAGGIYDISKKFGRLQ